MSDLEQRVLSQYRGFLDTWFSRGEASRSELMRFFGRPFHGLGTARHEVFGTKDALIAQFAQGPTACSTRAMPRGTV